MTDSTTIAVGVFLFGYILFSFIQMLYLRAIHRDMPLSLAQQPQQQPKQQLTPQQDQRKAELQRRREELREQLRKLK